MKILIVEDNALSMEIIKSIVADMTDCEIVTASNGEEMIELIAASSPKEYAMIITDLIMPGTPGIEAARQIRQMDRGDARNIPIIALSSYYADSEVAKAKEAGINEYMCKPINREQLAMLVGKYL